MRAHSDDGSDLATQVVKDFIRVKNALAQLDPVVRGQGRTFCD